MKLLISTMILLSIIITARLLMASTETDAGDNRLASDEHHYQIQIPYGFVPDQSIPELSILRGPGMVLRINSGCYELGLENLLVDSYPVMVAGQPALREDYYSASGLAFRRFTLYNKGKCYALELFSESHEGWEVLGKAVRTFRFGF